jgi:hypothetical protein
MWVPTDRAAASAAQADAQAPTTNVPAAVTAEDLAQLEASILQRVRMEVEEQLRTVSVPSQSLPVTLASSARIGDEDLESLLDRIAAIEQWKDDQITLNAIFNGQFGRLNSRTNSLTQQVELSRMQRAAFEAGAR